MPGLRVLITAWILCVVCSGCTDPKPIMTRGWPDVYWREGNYVLLAIDDQREMWLTLEDSPNALARATVFSVGANAHYIVAKQHPRAYPAVRRGSHSFDRTITNYFVIDRAKEKGPWPDMVRGPLSRAEFERLQQELDLPPFTTTFSTLNGERTGEVSGPP